MTRTALVLGTAALILSTPTISSAAGPAPTFKFDNSLKNPYNPSPEKEVYWSEQSWDEMYAPQARITVDSRRLKTTTRSTDQQRQR